MNVGKDSSLIFHHQLNQLRGAIIECLRHDLSLGQAACLDKRVVTHLSNPRRETSCRAFSSLEESFTDFDLLRMPTHRRLRGFVVNAATRSLKQARCNFNIFLSTPTNPLEAVRRMVFGTFTVVSSQISVRLFKNPLDGFILQVFIGQIIACEPIIITSSNGSLTVITSEPDQVHP